MEQEKILEIIKMLMPIQKQVNDKVQEKLGDFHPQVADYVLAYNVELYELINEIGIWKWWKEHNKPNKERVLDELADCFAFMLSAFIEANNEELLKSFVDFYVETKNAIKENYNPDTRIALVKDILGTIGTASELTEEHLSTLNSFCLVIIAVECLFKFEVDWLDFAQAYKQKSGVNIKRQEEHY